MATMPRWYASRLGVSACEAWNVAACEIRILAEEDWAIWREVRLRSLVDAPDVFGSKLADWQGAHDREDRWRARFDSVAFNAVALVDGSMVGTAGGMYRSADVAELISMWVQPELRGTGVGDALIDAVIDWATSASFECVVLAVRKGNHRAAALYLRTGFVLVGANPDDDTEDLMVRELAVSRRGGA
jgi:GNAT superfamily N-acetyltransferase